MPQQISTTQHARVVISVLRSGSLLVAAVFCLFASSSSAGAIPSPELIVGSVTSLSQLISLVAASLGGGAMIIGTRAGRGSAGTAVALRRLALGLGLVALGSLAVNAYQVLDGRRAERERLEATLIRPTPKSRDGATLDPLLREIPYAAQMAHPLGLDTDAAEQLVSAIAAGHEPDWQIIDIRETAETEAGSFPTAAKVRFPDLPTSGLDLASKKSLLICHNGNRSAETCAALAAKGVDCRFIRGGLEKFLAERRTIEGFGVRSLEDLRAIPDYQNHRTLLDTETVKRLIAEEGARFVDVRYPGEFEAHHLPGATNLPLRSMPSVDIAARLASLRQGPVIVPCYDRRSCFYGEILGLLLARSGGDFRGRYTVPWEYFVPPPRPPHVEKLLAEEARGWQGRLVDAVAAGLGRLAGAIGVVGAIVVAALLSRLAVLPVSLKAERDQAAARRIEPEIAALKQRLADDPVRLSRAVRALYRRAGLTPLLNMLALAFLPIMAVISLAVQRSAEAAPTPLLWLGSLADRDPLLVVPLLAAALLTLYVQLAFDLEGRRRLWLWLVSLPLLTVSLGLLGAGVGLYIVASALLLLVQRAIVTGAAAAAVKSIATRRSRARFRRLGEAGIVPLAAGADALAGCGNKAVNLARLMQLGLPVPSGVVLTARGLGDIASGPAAERKRRLDAVWRLAADGGRVAVRSSAAAEDGAAHSFAGVFESVLDVDRAGLEAAIARVRASFAAERVAAYGVDGGSGNVLVQRMIVASFAGVVFTRAPNAAGCLMVELVEGCGDSLVSGAAIPHTFTYSRLADMAQMPGEPVPPIDLGPLLALARRAETLFGRPQDVEWAYADGRFYVLQSRDIVGAAGDTEQGVVQEAWARALERVETEPPEAIVLAQNELTEMLPQPTPLSLSLMNDFWASGGSLDLACRRLGLSYGVDEASPPLVVSLLGRLYVDERQARSRGPAISLLDARRLRAMADDVAREFEDVFLPGFLARMAVPEVADYDRLPTAALLAELAERRRSFIAVTHVAVDTINVLAQFYLQDASRALEKLGRDPLAYLVPHEPTEPQRIVFAAGQLPERERRRALLAGFGHRAVLDYEIAQRRFAEDATGLEAQIVTIPPPASAGKSNAGEAVALPAPVAAAVARSLRFQTLKETAKHHSLRELAVLRRIVLALGRRLGLDELVFQLSLDELQATCLGGAADGPHATHGADTVLLDLRRRAADRARRRAILAAQPSLPTALSAADLVEAAAGRTGVRAPKGGIAGTRVAGSRVVTGRARVVADADAESGRPIAGLADGDIIVARMVHPSWIVYFPTAGGVVSALGGWLSHTALLAREADLAMIVGVRGLESIENGALIRLRLDGVVEPVVDDAALTAAQ